jgi:regulator of protease activity HflC (stomatin/prohibitin superfamily)
MGKPVVRFRINAEGLEVWNFGKWIKADEKVTDNVMSTLRNMFPMERRLAA